MHVFLKCPNLNHIALTDNVSFQVLNLQAMIVVSQMACMKLLWKHMTQQYNLFVVSPLQRTSVIPPIQQPLHVLRFPLGQLDLLGLG